MLESSIFLLFALNTQYVNLVFCIFVQWQFHLLWDENNLFKHCWRNRRGGGRYSEGGDGGIFKAAAEK
ncbi:hypothetical protein LINGRAHAP2_LOCUS20716, partial [Linum grandiflorum]